MLKQSIETRFKKNTCYAEPEQAINLAESLKSLSSDLYTDSKRFIYELLQNADDSAIEDEQVQVGIKFFDNNILVVAHTGKAFDERDLLGICSVSHGTKKDFQEKIGYKGIGFKSVFGQSNKVIIFSSGEYFRFDANYEFEWRNEWGEDQRTWEQKNDRSFLYPWQIIPIYTTLDLIPKEISIFLQNGNWSVATIIQLSKKQDSENAVKELSNNVNMFLFLKHINKITFDLSTTTNIEINRLMKDLIVLKKNGKTEAQWILHNITLEVPHELKSRLKDEKNIPNKLLNANNVELSFAAKKGEDEIQELSANENLLYAYLPTDEKRYSLPILINTSFLTTTNRESLHADSKWNQWLFFCIAIELFKWIAELVNGEYQYQAYRFIPRKFDIDDELSRKYNEGIVKALDSIPFIISKEQQLLKIKQAIIDFTFLSEKEFIGQDIIRKFVIESSANPDEIHKNPFIPNTGYGNILKKLGVSCFEWKDIPDFLRFFPFIFSHSAKNNIKLIEHFKYLNSLEKPNVISNEDLKKWPFILDHKNKLNRPAKIYFSTADDQNWDDPNGELLFLHPELQTWLSNTPEMRAWLESLGVVEKTDISYIEKTIIPNSENYTTIDSTISTIRNIFNLYLSGKIGKALLNQLSRLKLLTQAGTLLVASNCYLCNRYKPRLSIEEILDENIYVSEKYLSSDSDIEEWKRFFKMMGVKDGIVPTKYANKITKDKLIHENGFEAEYFDEDDKKFRPLLNIFKADSYDNLVSFNFLNRTNDFEFSKVFWADVIENLTIEEFNAPATAYWGYADRPGQISGNPVVNYLKWFVQNKKCLPVKTGECKEANSVFLNDDEIVTLSGGYLPVFDGKKLSPNWKSFFQFKSKLELTDYLDLLTIIVADTTKDGKLKSENNDRVQLVYKKLLDICINWSEDEIKQVKQWSTSARLPEISGIITECVNLKHYLDGDSSVFQGSYSFIYLKAENKNHVAIERLLDCFQVTILRQSNFKLKCEGQRDAFNLKQRLNCIIPYLEKWLKKENKEFIDNQLSLLKAKIEELEIFEAQELYITYGDDFQKTVQLHFDDNKLYVTSPWNSNKVLLHLSETLCDYLDIKGYNKELDFLLRVENKDEIQEYFKEEGIELPDQHIELTTPESRITPITKEILASLGISSAEELEKALANKSFASDFFHSSTPTSEMFQYAQHIIKRAVRNIVDHLKTLSEYECEDYEQIAPSILGGIKKNGNDVYIIARPSDNGEVIIYYSSEFDTLEFEDAELWYENGQNTPQKVTLGKILKITGINRIPVQL